MIKSRPHCVETQNQRRKWQRETKVTRHPVRCREEPCVRLSPWYGVLVVFWTAGGEPTSHLPALMKRRAQQCPRMAVGASRPSKYSWPSWILLSQASLASTGLRRRRWWPPPRINSCPTLPCCVINDAAHACNYMRLVL